MAMEETNTELTAQLGRLASISLVLPKSALAMGTRATRKGTIHFMMINKLSKESSRERGSWGIYKRFPDLQALQIPLQ